MNILDYDLFVFDFDGTIMDTEIYHCNAWGKALSNYLNKEIILDLEYYQKIFHSLEKNYSKYYLNIEYDINFESYNELYNNKQEIYKNIIKTENINLIDGIEDFLFFLKNNNKKCIIVTNTSINNIEIFYEKFFILNIFDKIYTKEMFNNKKPNSECYLKIVNDYKNLKIIGFEDSLPGIEALYKVSDILPVFINNKYYYKDYIIEKYKNIILLDNYNIDDLNISFKKIESRLDFLKNDNLFIENILNNNINELKNNFINMKNIISQISTLLKNIDPSMIYLSGMGKSGYVCKKSVSTWQSLSIKCSYIDLPNLPHGDFGIFKDNDVLILISNNGNTDEVIYILNYLKNLNKKITIISIIANKNSKMEELSSFTYILNNIKEADSINMTPSTSSLIFMSLLDGIAINMQKNITKSEFKLYHPGGSLGRL